MIRVMIMLILMINIMIIIMIKTITISMKKKLNINRLIGLVGRKRVKSIFLKYRGLNTESSALLV